MGQLRKGLTRLKRRLTIYGASGGQYQRIRAEDLKRELTTTKEPTYTLYDAEISGNLDLRRLTIDTALDLQRCKFQGKVDLSYCEFRQAVNFSGCTFSGEFNSGKDPEVHTIYRKDLICNGAVFEQDAFFTGARVEGDAYFSRYIPRDDTSPDDQCRIPSFKGAVSFRAFKCSGNGKFEGARFESDRVVDFRSASIGAQLNCSHTVFCGPVRFNALKVGGAAYFKQARFLSTETVVDIDVTSESDKYAVSFRHATFERHLLCEDALFKGPVSFDSVQCKSTGYFRRMRLEGERHIFRHASFEGDLKCSYSTFKGKVSDFNYLRVGGSLSLDRTYFDTMVKMGHISVSQKLSLEGSCFKERVGLYDANIRILELLNVNHPRSIEVRNPNNEKVEVVNLGLVADNEDSAPLSNSRRERRERDKQARDLADTLCPWGKGHSPDLTGTTFARFHSGRDDPLERELALKLADNQNPKTFSRDPYLQLEEFYRRTGNETKARNIYRLGREELRKNAMDRKSSIQWSWTRNIADWLWKWVTGYGVAISRLLFIVAVFILVGTLIFSPNEALDPVRQFANDGSREESPSPFLYSLDLFLPLVNLHVDNKWSPSSLPLQVYAGFHLLIGWLVVPLLLAALAGIMRR
jgi:hypothetical protein